MTGFMVLPRTLLRCRGGSGFRFFDFARVGFRVFGYFLGSPSGHAWVKTLHFAVNFDWIGKKLPKFRQRCKKLALFLKNLLLRVTWVLQNLLRVSSGS